MEENNTPNFKTAEELREAVADYFNDCGGQPLTDENGEPVRDKNGVPVTVGAHPPTVAGLALRLGFKTRRELLNYRDDPNTFDDIIAAAVTRCEEYAESRLYDRDGVNGAKFSLVNNFDGWQEKRVGKSVKSEVKIIDDL